MSVYDDIDLPKRRGRRSPAETSAEIAARFGLRLTNEPLQTEQAPPDGPTPPIAPRQKVRVAGDIPDKVLVGRLGEICQDQLGDFPRAMAWPSIVAAASVRVPLAPKAPQVRTNLYVGIVGPSQSGKTSCLTHSFAAMGLVAPTLMTASFGSAELMIESLKNERGSRLYFPDELAHPLIKAQIEGSVLALVLNTAYHEDYRTFHTRRGDFTYNCRLTVCGGVVPDKWDDCFGSAAVGGLYERFTFGLVPEGFFYEWTPRPDPVNLAPGAVSVDSDVFEARSAFRKSSGIELHVLEQAMRMAVICASMDGRPRLCGKDLEPFWRFAESQHHFRQAYQPNPGKTHDGVLTHKLLRYLDRFPEQWVNRRQALMEIHAYDYGGPAVDRVLKALIAAGEVKPRVQPAANPFKGGRPKEFIRRRAQEEP